MKRRVFVIMSVVSLLLFVAVVVLWVRSYVSPGGLGVIPLPDEGERTSGFSAVRGELRWVTFRGMSQDENRAASGWRRDWVLVTAGEVGAVSPAQPVEGVFLRRRWVAVRFWALALLLALVTAATARGTIRRVVGDRRRRRGLCPVCGYDVRATPRRCPECGVVGDL